MEVKREINGYDEIKEMSWCCDHLWERIEEYGLEDEAVSRIEEVFSCSEDIPTETDVNDYIRFELWDALNIDSYIDAAERENEENDEEL